MKFSSAHRLLTGVCLAITTVASILAAEPLSIPIGLDAYRQWDKWPYQRIGVRAYMRSTYDRRGGNEGADASHFLYQLADDNNVTLDVAGAGVLYFARYNHWHGSPWRYVVDGSEHIVQESSTANPNSPVDDSVFLPKELFPWPLAVTWATTRGADLMWVPISFEKSFRMGYSRTRYGTGYYIYHQFVPGIKLSQPFIAWDGHSTPERDVLKLISSAGTDLSPTEAEEFTKKLPELTPGEHKLLLDLKKPPGTIRKLSFSVPRERAIEFGRARLRITWDGRAQPSVDAPVALFFGAGTLYNRDDREYFVKAFPSYIRFYRSPREDFLRNPPGYARYDEARVELACFFPMPFFKSARIELIGPPTNSVNDIVWSVKHEPFEGRPQQVGYFHATYRDHPSPEAGKDLVLLDTRETEGGGDWSGNFIGTSWIFSDQANLTTLEGDPRFFFDDSQTPQAYGTGTEEWGGGGDYWGGLNMTLPFAGHPCGARNLKEAKNDEDKIESAYRFLLADLMPFGKNAVIRLEHGGENQSTEHYQSVTYWYGAPAAALVKSDELKIGDANSESKHSYVSPNASAPYEIVSRYELGIDSLAHGQDRPEANPTSYAEYEFQAEANAPYSIWLRGANIDGSLTSDASWLQFDEDIGTPKMSSYGHPKGFGNWLDLFSQNQYAWSSALPNEPPRAVTFKEAGTHKLRIQPRHPGHRMEQIWLSSSQKNLPDAAFAPANATSEILLAAANAKLIKGSLKVVQDARSRVGRVLEMGTATTQADVYPAHSDYGRKTTGTSEFTLKLNPKNLGVMLRRKLDYSFPNQRAEVFVADVTKDPTKAKWKAAGIWYLAGGNTCIYSNPKEELGATQHNVQTSNRRFRDDEFLLPLDLTMGRSAIRVRVKFTPVEIPLFPGNPLPELAWSEIRYDVYCYVMPEWKPGKQSAKR